MIREYKVRLPSYTDPDFETKYRVPGPGAFYLDTPFLPETLQSPNIALQKWAQWAC